MSKKHKSMAEVQAEVKATAGENVPKERKGPAPLPTLTGEVGEQWAVVMDVVAQAMGVIKEATLVPNRHLYFIKSNFGQQLGALIKTRRPDPKAKKRARLEASLARIKDELNELA